ncbi:MAG: formate dehydrogenase accessory sulfurtransferase FdhD [Phycisphaerales bacterium]
MTEAADTRRCATDARAVLVLRAGVATRRDDRIAVEAPLEIRIAGQPLCITMRTPGDDPDLVAGFLLGEGIVAASEEIAHIGIDALADDADVAHVARHRPAARPPPGAGR